MEFGGKDIIILPDNAPEMAHLPTDSIGSTGNRYFVRESMWPALKVAIDSQSRAFVEP